MGDRICVLQLDTKALIIKTQNKFLFTSIINVYGPTTERKRIKIQRNQKKIHTDLNNTLEPVKNKFLLLTGDFNSKVGKRQKENICVGTVF